MTGLINIMSEVLRQKTFDMFRVFFGETFIANSMGQVASFEKSHNLIMNKYNIKLAVVAK